MNSSIFCKLKSIVKNCFWKFALGDLKQSSSLERKVSAEQFRILVTNTPRNLTTGIIAAGIMTASICVGVFPTTPFSALGWCLSIWIALLSGIVISRNITKASFTDEKLLCSSWKLHAVGIVCGSLWGALSWIIIPLPDRWLDLLLIMSTAIVFLGGAATQGVYRRHQKFFLLPATVFFSSGLLASGEKMDVLIAIGFPLLAFVILSASKTIADSVAIAIVFRVRTEELLDAMSAQQTITNNAKSEAELAWRNAEENRISANKARDQAERADMSKTRFLVSASHDLRQPMHALVQYFGQLRYKNKDCSLEETLDRIAKSLDAMQDLLNSTLEASKLMMGSVRPSSSVFPIFRLLDRIDAQLRPIAEDKGLFLTIKNPNCFIKTDEILLERILRNIILNSIIYTNSGGIVIKFRHQSNNLYMHIRDSGIGIKKEEFPKIFEEFYQVGNEARDRRKGLGLGLFVVQELCGLLGIRLRMRSIYGVGTVFILDLAIEKSKSSFFFHSDVQRRPRDFLNGSTVLLIDDNVENLEATAITLKSFGCSVTVAFSGAEAAQKIRQEHFSPQLIICDYRIGNGETGIQAIAMVINEQFRLFSNEFSTDAIVISGDTGVEELNIVEKAGYLMLHKPVKVEVLYEVMNDKLKSLTKK